MQLLFSDASILTPLNPSPKQSAAQQAPTHSGCPSTAIVASASAACPAGCSASMLEGPASPLCCVALGPLMMACRSSCCFRSASACQGAWATVSLQRKRSANVGEHRAETGMVSDLMQARRSAIFQQQLTGLGARCSAPLACKSLPAAAVLPSKPTSSLCGSASWSCCAGLSPWLIITLLKACIGS